VAYCPTFDTSDVLLEMTMLATPR